MIYTLIMMWTIRMVVLRFIKTFHFSFIGFITTIIIISLACSQRLVCTKNVRRFCWPKPAHTFRLSKSMWNIKVFIASLYMYICFYTLYQARKTAIFVEFSINFQYQFLLISREYFGLFIAKCICKVLNHIFTNAAFEIERERESLFLQRCNCSSRRHHHNNFRVNYNIANAASGVVVPQWNLGKPS